MKGGREKGQGKKCLQGRKAPTEKNSLLCPGAPVARPAAISVLDTVVLHTLDQMLQIWFLVHSFQMVEDDECSTPPLLINNINLPTPFTLTGLKGKKERIVL